MAETDKKEKDTKVKGSLYQSLERSNKQIRQERGDAIAEDLEMIYKRNVEDIQLKIRQKTRDRANMFDFSPTNSQSLVLMKDLESATIKDKDMEISLELRELKIRLEIAEGRYLELFAKTV